MPRVLRRIGAPSPVTMAVVFTRWADVAGEVLARHVEPLRIDGSTLLLTADHPTWATRARIESRAIIERARALGDTHIERIEIVIQRP
jgi:predicted nucleic acid-binding Zn ribbon protein